MATSNTIASLAAVVIGPAANSVANKTAFLRDFTLDLSSDIVSPRKATVQVPLYKTGSTTSVNPTTFGASDTSGDLVTITMNHLSQNFALTNADYQNGHRLENLVKKNVDALCDKIQSTVFTNLTTGNFTATVTGVTAGGTTNANINTLYGALKGDDRVLYLTSTEYKNFLPTAQTSFSLTQGQPAYGYDKFSRFDTGAPAKLAGFASCNKAGLVIASAIPEKPAKVSEGMDSMIIDLGDTGLQAELNVWADPTTREDRASIDLYFGCAVGDKDAIKLITNA